jgi:periplasmic protein TonB
MRDAVSEVLVDRAQEADRLAQTLACALLAHIALIAAIYYIPESWRRGKTDDKAPVMTITLGGTPGPQAGGMTSIAARPVQEVAPPAAKPVPQPIAPAPKPPEMVLPRPDAKATVKPPVKPVDKPDDKSSGRKPTTGTEVKTGSARVDTQGAQTPFGGLATGGGGAGGARLDVQNFCCPDYLVTMSQLIQKNWSANQGVTTTVDVKFTIQRNGTITDAQLEKPSGYFQLDQEALRAVARTRMLPPLPREFPETHLTVHLTFDYKR